MKNPVAGFFERRSASQIWRRYPKRTHSRDGFTYSTFAEGEETAMRRFLNGQLEALLALAVNCGARDNLWISEQKEKRRAYAVQR